VIILLELLSASRSKFGEAEAPAPVPVPAGLLLSVGILVGESTGV